MLTTLKLLAIAARLLATPYQAAELGLPDPVRAGQRGE